MTWRGRSATRRRLGRRGCDRREEQAWAFTERSPSSVVRTRLLGCRHAVPLQHPVSLVLEMLADGPQICHVPLHPSYVSCGLSSVLGVQRTPTDGRVALCVVIEVAEHDQLFGRKVLVPAQRRDLIVDSEESFCASFHVSPPHLSGASLRSGPAGSRLRRAIRRGGRGCLRCAPTRSSCRWHRPGSRSQSSTSSLGQR